MSELGIQNARIIHEDLGVAEPFRGAVLDHVQCAGEALCGPARGDGFWAAVLVASLHPKARLEVQQGQREGPPARRISALALWARGQGLRVRLRPGPRRFVAPSLAGRSSRPSFQ
jgi:hypothetical protein